MITHIRSENVKGRVTTSMRRFDLKSESCVMTGMDLKMDCDKEQWKQKWFAAWQKQSVDAWINRSDSISKEECFTWDSDVTSPLDSQIVSDEIQMSSVRNKQVWGKNERKNERKFPNKQILGSPLFRIRNKPITNKILILCSWWYLGIICEI